jgi:hypothetical protein
VELTQEKIQAAMEAALDRGGKPPERLLSTHELGLLWLIQQVEPGWDSWSFGVEIRLKAKEMGLA